MGKVEIKDVDLYYGDVQALKKVNMNIEANKITALIGPSGCGKSTLLRSVNRLNELIPGCKVKGEILIDGYNIYGPKTDVVDIRKRVGLIFQRPNPFPKSIYDNIAFGPRLQGERNKKKLDETVEVTLRGAGLWDEVKDRLNHTALDLSGGQQQRLCIARALAIEPEVILMDEPCSALDPIATDRIEELCLKLKDKYTIIMVTHNMQQAGRISDYTGFMYMGELIEFGETNKLFIKPEQELTEKYVTGRFG